MQQIGAATCLDCAFGWNGAEQVGQRSHNWTLHPSPVSGRGGSAFSVTVVLGRSSGGGTVQQLDNSIGGVNRWGLEISILDPTLDRWTRRAGDKADMTWGLERRSEHSAMVRKDEGDGQTVRDVEGFI